MNLSKEFAAIVAPVRDSLEAEGLTPAAVKRVECITAQAMAALVQMDRRHRKPKSLGDQLLDEFKRAMQ